MHGDAFQIQVLSLSLLDVLLADVTNVSADLVFGSSLKMHT